MSGPTPTPGCKTIVAQNTDNYVADDIAIAARANRRRHGHRFVRPGRHRWVRRPGQHQHQRPGQLRHRLARRRQRQRGARRRVGQQRRPNPDDRPLPTSYAISSGSYGVAKEYSRHRRQPRLPAVRERKTTVDIGAYEFGGVATPATGGTAISAETAGQSFTTLTGPLYEGIDLPIGTIVLNAPHRVRVQLQPRQPAVRWDHGHQPARKCLAAQRRPRAIRKRRHHVGNALPDHLRVGRLPQRQRCPAHVVQRRGAANLWNSMGERQHL